MFIGAIFSAWWNWMIHFSFLYPFISDSWVLIWQKSFSHNDSYVCDKIHKPQKCHIVHYWQKYISNCNNCGKISCSRNCALSNSIIVLPVLASVYMEIKGWITFRSSLAYIKFGSNGAWNSFPYSMIKNKGQISNNFLF